MTIKEKIVEKRNGIDDRLKIGSLKFHYIALGIIILAIPLTVILVEHQTNDSVKATSEDQALQSETSDPNAFDEFDETPEVLTAPEISVIQDSTVIDNAVVKATTSKPNIIVVMLDDVNPMDGRLWNYMPNMKNLFVSKGVTFTNAYGETPLCCPGRAQFLTGQHTRNNGVNDNNARLLNPTMTIATELKKAGYYTFWAGKYLNGTENLSDKKPPGWDNVSIYSGGYYGYYLYNNGSASFKGSSAKDYSTDVIRDKSLAYMRSAPANKPIFGVIAPYAIHITSPSNKQPTIAPRHLNHAGCEKIPDWKPANYNEADVSDKPQYVRKKPLLDDKNGLNIVKFCKALLSVDEMIGKVKNELQMQGRLSNTVFIFTADNGMNFGSHRFDQDKKTPYATQIPLFVYWPNRLGTTPKTINETISNIDFAPTLCEVGGCKMGPYPNGQTKADGISFLPLLLGTKNTLGRNAILENYTQPGHYIKPWYGIRTTSSYSDGLWHYIEHSSGEKELYDLSGGPCYSWIPSMGGDPCELKNLLGPGTNPSKHIKDIKNALSAKLAQLKQEK